MIEAMIEAFWTGMSRVFYTDEPIDTFWDNDEDEWFWEGFGYE